MEYYESVHKLSKTMFRLIALSLGLPETHFDYFASDPNGSPIATTNVNTTD
jgi:isopenicillin N synthase-like dioxygenase